MIKLERIYLVIGIGFLSIVLHFIILKKIKENVNMKTFTLDDFVKRKFPLKGFGDTFISDNEILLAQREDVAIFNFNTRQETILLSKDLIEKYKGGSISISPDRKRILFRYDGRRFRRFTTEAKCAVFDLETNKTYEIEGNARLKICDWTPKGDGIVYIYKENLYHWAVNNEHYPLTIEGKEGVIFAGSADAIYEGQITIGPGLFWYSPDGSNLAILQLDATNVSTYSYEFFKDSEPPHDYLPYPRNADKKYTMAGGELSKVLLRIKKTQSEISYNWTDFEVPIYAVTSDHIFHRFVWIDEENFVATWMNREQNILSIQACDISGSCREVIRLEEPSGWHFIYEVLCYKETNSCLFVYWIDDWPQIWNLDLATGTNRMEPVGNFSVLRIYGYRASSNDVFFLGTREGHPEENHIYRNNKCLSCKLRDIDGVACTYAYAFFSTDLSYFVIVCDAPTARYSKIFKTEADTEVEIMDWHRNEALRNDLKEYRFPAVKYLTFPIADGYSGYAKLLVPPEMDLDEKNPALRYPLIVYVYGGPDIVHVREQFAVLFETYLVTSRKVIYAFIDGRGSTNKGKNYLFALRKRFGTVEIDDAFNISRQIQERYAVIDKERIGIWGWSYGGYATAKIIGRDSERFFRCGIAVGGVSSWLHYGALYSERYMGSPKDEENLKRYIASDASLNVENFKSHEFLLMHGLGDDNVHFSNALKLATALQNANIQFQFMVYADELHSIPNYAEHVFSTMDSFWVKCLNLN